jgi:hypothetical protein
MGDPMTQAKLRGREEQKPVDWPATAHVEPLQAIASDWDRSLNQAPDNPKVPNPKRTRAERDAYTNSGGNNV